MLGLSYVPLVIEAHGGGWSKLARKTFDVIASQLRATSDSLADAASLTIAQRLSVTLHRENARAVVRRLPAPTAADGVGDWDPGAAIDLLA